MEDSVFPCMTCCSFDILKKNERVSKNAIRQSKPTAMDTSTQKKGILRFFCLIVTGVFFILLDASGGTAFAQTDDPQNLKTRLTALIDQIEADFQQSRYETEIENYGGAQSKVESAIKSIDVLVKIFMPLAERIKAIINEEKFIKHQTQNLIDQFIAENERTVEKRRDGIVQKQLSNRNDTLEILALLERQLQQLDATADSGPADSPPSRPDREKTKETLAKVDRLLEEAVTFENRAINGLEAAKLDEAVADEQRSIEKMEEALKQLQGEDSKQPQNRQNDQSASNDSNDSRQNPQSGEQKGKGQQEKATDTAKKMSVDDALKELSRIDKKAREERDRREKKYGAVRVPGPIPVEKDW